MINAANFHISTKATWTVVADTWSNLVAQHGLNYSSVSGSAYVTDGITVWRKADHWGWLGCSGCEWMLNEKVGGREVVACVKFSEMNLTTAAMMKAARLRKAFRPAHLK